MRDVIHTQRLILRPLSVSDAPIFCRYMGQYEVAKMTGSIPHPLPLISAEVKIMMLNSQKRRGIAYPYAVTLDGTEMIGVADIFKRSAKSDWELGYWIAAPFWGSGYAGEAMRAVMDEAMQSLNVSTFIAGVWHDNPASMRVLEKLGFKATGSDGKHFSIARLQNVESFGFVKQVTTPLPETRRAAIHAC